MNYFTSDWHLLDERQMDQPNVLLRPPGIFGSTESRILKSLDRLTSQDRLFHLGNVILSDDMEMLKILQEMPEVYKTLVVGNHDEERLDVLMHYFDNIVDEAYIHVGNNSVHLSHYPANCQKRMASDSGIDFSLTGHIHGLWKVKPKMINVGVDAWHFNIVSEEEILYVWNAMQNHYDRHVFA